MRSTDPRGPFEAFTAPVTPLGWFCLDGHLYFGEANPLIVFCREWIEVGDGEMYYAPLSADLTCLAGDPIRLFSASEAPWTNPIDGEGVKYVTDGPFLWKSRATGELLMLWSSIGANGNYCVRRNMRSWLMIMIKPELTMEGVMMIPDRLECLDPSRDWSMAHGSMMPNRYFHTTGVIVCCFDP